ncbi:MAG: PEP-CTERM sorting domain-containing protein, partial [Verrucomicrobia bacterium]|nr:PEP-CTERM sorting domain-containing protein [Verrucomicrobiota bacterium]
LEWSVSDLRPQDVPLHGKQGDTAGPGVFTDSRSHLLQTYTFVPEPSAALLATLAGLTFVLRRRRDYT